jgi:6,7-dimethyl-8-ribityllumazine synthase
MKPSSQTPQEIVPGASPLRQVFPGIVEFEGALDAAPFSFGIAVSRFNGHLTRAMAETAVTCLKKSGAREEQVTLAWVPGSFELPLVLESLAKRGGFSALIGLGVVIQGETPHATLITTEVTHGLARISSAYGVPVIDGVIAALTPAQAEARALGGEGSRGWYAARAAIEMASLMRRL